MDHSSTQSGKTISTNIVWHDSAVTRDNLSQKRGHRSFVLWFTGLSGSGKSTLANAVNLSLFHQGLSSYLLDGDNIRHGLCKDLGFSDFDREENIRRIGEVSKLFVDAGIIVATAFVSPFIADRKRARELFAKGDFIEIYCAASLDICEKRDTKGLYAKARSGEIKNFTGIDSPYEKPINPEISIDTGKLELDQCVNIIVEKIKSNSI